MKARGSRASRSIRVLSPRIEPPERVEEGSTASTARRRPAPVRHQAEAFDEARLADAGRAGQPDAERRPGELGQGIEQHPGGVPVVGACRFDERDRSASARRSPAATRPASPSGPPSRTRHRLRPCLRRCLWHRRCASRPPSFDGSRHVPPAPPFSPSVSRCWRRVLAAAEQASFTFSIAGIKVGTMTMVSEQTGSSYNATSKINTAGLAGMFDFFFDGTASGSIAGGGRRCRRSMSQPRSRCGRCGTPDRLARRRASQRVGRAAARVRARAGEAGRHARPGVGGLRAVPDSAKDAICNTGSTCSTARGALGSALPSRNRARTDVGLRRHVCPHRGRGAQHGRPSRIPVLAHLRAALRTGATSWSESRHRPISGRRCSTRRG